MSDRAFGPPVSTVTSQAFYDQLWAGTRRVDQHHKCRIDALERMIRLLPAPASGRRRILELGCGSGLVAEALVRHGEVTGIDLSPVGIELARARVPGRFEVGVLPAIPIPDADFDLCVLSQVVEHFTDTDQVALLTNARERVLARGHLLLTTPNRPVSARMRFAHGELQPLEHWLDPAELHQLLARTGWRVVATRFAFNFYPVLISRHPPLRAVRYLLYDVLRLRRGLETLLDGPQRGDCTVVLAARA